MDKLYKSSEHKGIVFKEICRHIPDDGFIFCAAYKNLKRFPDLDGDYQEKKLKLINNGLRVKREGKNK